MALLDWILGLSPHQAFLFGLPFLVSAVALWADSRDRALAAAQSRPESPSD